MPEEAFAVMPQILWLLTLQNRIKPFPTHLNYLAVAKTGIFFLITGSQHINNYPYIMCQLEVN